MEKFLSSAKTFFVNLFNSAKEKFNSLKQRIADNKGTEQNESKTPVQKALTAVGITLCVIFSFFLICNLVIIIKGTVAPEMPPSVFGVTPMVVQSGSMSGNASDHIEVGDLIFIGKADPDELKEGDIIAFMDGKVTVTHRIIRVETAADGSPRWITKGDANNKEDSKPVTAENLVGIYNFRIAKLGDVAMFLQQPVGMLVVIGLPCLAFIIYDIIRRQRSAAKNDEKTSEMEAELERLRKLVGAQEGSASDEADNAAETDAEETLDEETPAEDTSSEETSAEETAEEPAPEEKSPAEAEENEEKEPSEPAEESSEDAPEKTSEDTDSAAETKSE